MHLFTLLILIKHERSELQLPYFFSSTTLFWKAFFQVIMDTILNGFYKSKENTVCLLAWYCMRASKTFFTEYYGAENFTWLESVMSRTIGSTMVYRGETLECSKWEKEEGIRSRSFRLCRKLTLLDIFYLFPSL